jgi:SWI/SNF-related matrix-associated actin-dependent regulator 1 of chromatin subfamily A
MEVNILSIRPCLVRIKFDYNDYIITGVKQFPKRKYDVEEKSWILSLFDVETLNKFKGFCDEFGFIFPEELNKVVFDKPEPVISKNPNYTLFNNGLTEIYFGYNKDLVDGVKLIPNRKFVSDKKCWQIKIVVETVIQLKNYLTKFEFTIDEKSKEEIGKVYEEALVKEKRQIENLEKSKASISNLEVPGLKGTLRPFQKAGVEYAILNKKVIIGDEMGLGKTIESIATVQYLSAYPCLVACPNSLKYNWKNEWVKWVDKKVIIINSEDELTEELNIIEDTVYPIGYKVENKDGWYQMTENGLRKIKDEVGEVNNPDLIIKKFNILEADVIIVNYNTAAKYQDLLKKISWKSVISDESHYLKEQKTNRTRAIKNLTKGVDVVLLLTGTMTINRPVELTPQLEILGILEEFGGWWGFVKKYCNVHNNGFGLNVKGSNIKMLPELHEQLRKTCYIRRNKNEVLKELPDKQRVVVEVDLTNRLKYIKAEKALINYLRNEVEVKEEDLREYYKTTILANEVLFEQLNEKEKLEVIKEYRKNKARKAESAEHLVQINTLKQLAIKGKMEAIKEWISDFLETGEKLVVFGIHTDIINELSEYFKCHKITGEVKVEDRQKFVDDFQENEETKLIFLNIQAGGVGLTLTKSSNVLFVEEGWTPGEHQQAEDRCHRMGQKGSVTCYYMLGKNTIDIDIYELIEKKAVIVNSINKGEEFTGDVKILNELVMRLMNRN